MSDLKITSEKAKTYDDDSVKNSILKTPQRLESFGEAQNAYNKLLMENITDLKRRICSLEDERERNIELFKRFASELQSFKAELDRQKLTSKLNSNTLDRLTKIIDISSGKEE